MPIRLPSKCGHMSGTSLDIQTAGDMITLCNRILRAMKFASGPTRELKAVS